SQELNATPIADWSSIKVDFEELAHPLLGVNSPKLSRHGLVATGFGRRVLTLSGVPKPLQDDSQTAAIGSRLDAIESFRAALGESIFGRATVAGDRLYTVDQVRDRPSALY